MRKAKQPSQPPRTTGGQNEPILHTGATTGVEGGAVDLGAVNFTMFDDDADPGDTTQPHAHTPQPLADPRMNPTPGDDTTESPNSGGGLPQWPATTPTTFQGWIHPATDAKGHDTKLALKVMPAVARQMSLVVASKQFPYRTVQELIRHAIYQHLDWLLSFNQTIPSVMAQVDSINVLIADEMLLLEQNDVLARHLAATESHIRMGDYASAQRIIDVAMAQLQRLPPGSWRDSYVKRFSEMYQTNHTGQTNSLQRTK
jgi:hypothetical protein